MREVLHERDLSDQIYKCLTPKDRAKELGRVCEAIVRLGLVLAELVVGTPQVDVAEDLIGFADGLELCVCGIVTGVLVCTC